MTLISTIISDAYRETNITALGDSPTSAESTEALTLLNRYIVSLFGSGVGENMQTMLYGTNGVHNTEYDLSSVIDQTFVPQNTRLLANLSAAKTVYLPPNPEDGARFGVVDTGDNFATYNLIVNANGKNIETSNSVTLSTNSLAREWFYRRDTGNWARLADLVTSDSSPFPQKYDDMLVIGLALRLQPRHGRSLPEESIAVWKDLKKQFKAQYSNTKEKGTELGLLTRNRLPYAGTLTDFQLGRIR